MNKEIEKDLIDNIKEIKCDYFKATILRVLLAYKCIERLKELHHHCCVSNIVIFQDINIVQDLENICDKNSYMMEKVTELVKEIENQNNNDKYLN
jgi:hypothetical protein